MWLISAWSENTCKCSCYGDCSSVAGRSTHRRVQWRQLRCRRDIQTVTTTDSSHWKQLPRNIILRGSQGSLRSSQNGHQSAAFLDNLRHFLGNFSCKPITNIESIWQKVCSESVSFKSSNLKDPLIGNANGDGVFSTWKKTTMEINWHSLLGAVVSKVSRLGYRDEMSPWSCHGSGTVFIVHRKAMTSRKLPHEGWRSRNVTTSRHAELRKCVLILRNYIQ